MTPRPSLLLLMTPLLGGQVALPLAEDFEAEPPCEPECGVPCELVGPWANATDDAAEWIVDADGTPSTGTGPTVDFDPGLAGGHYAYVEASGSCSPAAEAWLLSPLLDLGEGAVLSFRYHQDGLDMGTLSVDQQEPLRHVDGVLVGATETLSSPSADFSALVPGMHIAIVGSSSNAGVFPITQVLDPSSVVLDTGATATDEALLSFDAWHPQAPWTLDLFGPVSDDEDRWQHAACVPLAPTGAESRVRFAALTGPAFSSDMAIDAISIEAPPPVDLAIEAIAVDPLGCGETSTLLTATVVNRGQDPLQDVELTFRVDGGPGISEVVPGSIEPCETVVHAFAAPVALGTLGSHVVSVEHGVAGDANSDDDLAELPVHAPLVLASFPASDDLEDDAAGRWRTGGEESSWAVGTPAKSVISGAASGATAWVTGGLGAGGYNPLEDSFVEGPCYDFSALADPRLELSVWWEAEFGWDGARVESSVDDGATWLPVGAFGDEVNWYSDDSVAALPGGQGWSGASSTSNGSGQWLPAGHDLGALAGEPMVRLRLRFASDSGVQDDGFAFDDWTVLDDPAGVAVSSVVEAVPVAALPVASGGVQVLVFEAEARVDSASISALSLTLQGIEDGSVSAVDLWLDDGDGAFDPAFDLPFQDNPQSLFNGVATFTTVSELLLPAYLPRRVFASVDLRASAAGAVLQASLDPADVVASAAMLTTSPLLGPSRGIFQSATPPLLDDFSGGSPHRSVDLGPGSFPESVGVGLPPLLGSPTLAPGSAGLVGDDLQPAIPSSRVRLSPPEAVALDYHLDLSAHASGPADLTLLFAWEQLGGQVEPGDGVFLSVDGGQNWGVTLFALPSGPPQVLDEVIDLDAAVQAAGLTLTDEVVLRFQAVGFGSEDLLLDDLFVGTQQDLRVVRDGGLEDGATDLVGDLPTASPTQLSWELHNDGHVELSLDAPALSGLVNLDGASVVAAPSAVAAGGMELLTLELTAAGAGPVSLAVSLGADDPRLLDGAFEFTLLGEGTVEPDLLLVYEGLPRGDGDLLDVGVHTAGRTLDVVLDLSNEGTGPLSFVGAAPLLFANAQNVVVSVDTPPPSPLGPGEQAAAELAITPQFDGPFSIDVLIQTDDPTDPLLTVTLHGIAVSPGLQIVRGSIIPPGGSEDAGLLRPGTVVTWGYSLNNNGTGDVSLLGSPDPVVILNLSGPVLAVVTSQPATLIPTAASVGFVLDFEVVGLGLFSFDVLVESNDTDHPAYLVSVLGEGVEPELQLVDDSGALEDGAVIDLGDLRVGSSTTWLAAVDNLGTGDLALTAAPPVALTDQLALSAIVIQQPAAVVPPGGSEPIEVLLTPSALGPFSTVFTLASDDADEPSTSVLLQGVGVLPALRVERAGVPLVDGGEDPLGQLRRQQTATLAWVVANDGSGPLALVGAPEPVAVLDPVGVQASIVSPPPAVLLPGQEAVLVLELVPLADGFHFDLVLPSDDPVAPSFTLHASGTAVAPVLALSREDAPIPPSGIDDLGEVALAPATFAWTISNPGSAPLAWTAPPGVEATAGVLVEPAGALPTIPPGGDAELRLAIVPAHDGDFAFDVLLSSDDPDTPLYPFTVVASAASPRLRLWRGEVELLDGATEPLGDIEVGASITWTWRLSNEGTADAQLLASEPLALRGVQGLLVTDVVAPPSVLAAGTSVEIAVVAQAVAPGPIGFELALRRAAGEELEIHGVGVAFDGTEPPTPEPEGCSCRSSGGAGFGGVFLTPLLLRRRRRSP